MSSRQSVYPTADLMASQHILNSLSSCISSVDLTCRTLESMNEHLRGTTEDYKRFSKAITSKKHFDLISEREIVEAKSHLSAEIAPQLKELIIRAEDALQKEERKSKTLKSKAAQVSLRLEQVAQLHGVPIEKQGSNQNDHRSLSTTAIDTEVERLQRELKSLQTERVARQREMNELERDLKRAREAGRAN